ncbi:MAG: MerR family transcriptional regulator [Chloroflexi bacterium]|nr:MerR family transcriptional regulator [Chloroflexota bacterium]
MFKIGDFSKLSRVSVKMLRHYDQLGLLKPAYVDPFSEYRYYSADQLPRLNRILALKDLGLTLEQIARVLDENISGEQLRGMLTLKRAEIEQQVRAELNRLARIETRLRQIEGEGTLPAHDIVLRTVPAQLVAGLRQSIEADSAVAPLFDELETYVARHKARAARAPLLLCHESEHRARLDLEVVVPLTNAIPASARVTVYELPGIEAACIVFTGPYDVRMAEAAAALFRWADAHAYQAAGPTREVFLRFGADDLGFPLPAAYLTHEPAAYVTELQLPLRRAPARQA